MRGSPPGGPGGLPRAGGLLLIDKAEGPTSMAVVERIRRALGESRAGHVGTLDPMATGLLPVLVGKATRLLDLVLPGRKTYETDVLLGRATNTDDVTGETLAEMDAAHVTRGDVEAALPRFIGEVRQRPPRFSAVKVDGKRSYKRARRGEEVEPPERVVRIDAIEILDFEPPRVRLRIRCGSGTYVRAVARDLGEALGVGGTVQTLRRTQVGPFDVERALSIDALETLIAEGAPLGDALVPAPDAIPAIAAVWVPEADLARLRNGGAIPTAAPSEAVESAARSAEGVVKCMDGGDLVAVARLERTEAGAWMLRPLKVLD